MKTVLLWIVCIPAGIISMVLVQAIHPLLVTSPVEGSYYYYITYTFSSVLGGYFGVYVSALLAPSHKKWIASALPGVFLVSAFLLFLFQINSHRGWFYFFESAATLMGMIFGVYHIFVNKVEPR